MTKTIQIKLDDSVESNKKIMDYKKERYPHLTYTGFFMELARKELEELKGWM